MFVVKFGSFVGLVNLYVILILLNIKLLTHKLVLCKCLQQYSKSKVHPVMIISYEMFLRNVDVIKKMDFDMLVCDEGHRLKNINVKTSLVRLLLEHTTTTWFSFV